MRRKSFPGIIKPEAEPQHGHWTEYLIEILGIVTSLMYIVGCYCFESTDRVIFEFGDLLFLVACAISCVIGVFEVAENLHHKNLMKSEERDEVVESAMFLISHLLFTWGCFYFLPEVEGRMSTAGAWGAWLCIVGSFALCFAVYYTALTFSSDETVIKMLHDLEPSAALQVRQCKKIQMSLLLVGAILFTVGSFMYRPVFAGECQQGSTNATCMAVQEYGTTCYLWGSYIFLVASLIGTYVAYLKHSSQKHDDGSGKALGAGSNALMYNTV